MKENALKTKGKVNTSTAYKDFFVLSVILVLVFILSYFFNVFSFLVRFFQKNNSALTWIDEIITCSLTLSLGFAVISWRRLSELKKETAEKIKLQEKIIEECKIKEETERIICKQLHCDIEDYKKRINGLE